MQPPPDAVGEFKVVTNNMSAEYGRAAGATVNVVYQSGTNRFRGSGWEFFRDTALNATGFFKPANGQKPPLERNQFGGVIGGPILKNRAFFFADYEGFRQTRQSAVSSVIPSPLQRQGILSVAVVDPRSGIVYPAGMRIPMTTFAQSVLSALPIRRTAATTTRSSRNSPTTPTRPAERSISRSVPRSRCSGATAGAISRPSTSPISHCPRAAMGTGRSMRKTSSSRWAPRSYPTAGRSSSSASDGQRPGRARIRRRSDRRARSSPSAFPDFRPTRASAAGCRAR